MVELSRKLIALIHKNEINVLKRRMKNGYDYFIY